MTQLPGCRVSHWGDLETIRKGQGGEGKLRGDLANLSRDIVRGRHPVRPGGLVSFGWRSGAYFMKGSTGPLQHLGMHIEGLNALKGAGYAQYLILAPVAPHDLQSHGHAVDQTRRE